MKYRKLRIAWSVVWGIAAVLLVVLWVRSYWRIDSLSYNARRVASYRGSIFIDEEFSTPSQTTRMKLQVSQGSINGKPIQYVTSVNDFTPRGVGFKVPFWAPTLAIASLSLASAILFLPFRFSVRTLLIATTLVAIMLGLIAWAR